jgi:nuclease-like protein
VAYDVQREPAAWVTRRAKQADLTVWSLIAGAFVVSGVFLYLTVNGEVGVAGATAFLLGALAAKPRIEAFIDGQQRWWQGAHAERAVGETLNELRAETWTVVHDIRLNGIGGNVDHVVRGPGGVFLIETKLRRYRDEDLPRVKRQAALLSKELEGCWVSPVICLAQRNAKPFRTHGVWIVPRRHLLDWLRAQHKQTVSFETFARFADRIVCD